MNSPELSETIMASIILGVLLIGNLFAAVNAWRAWRVANDREVKRNGN